MKHKWYHPSTALGGMIIDHNRNWECTSCDEQAPLEAGEMDFSPGAVNKWKAPPDTECSRSRVTEAAAELCDRIGAPLLAMFYRGELKLNEVDEKKAWDFLET